MKGLSIAVIVLGVCILISSWIITTAFTNSRIVQPSTINIPEISNPEMNSHYELIVQDGFLYLYDKSNGQVFKKLDDDPNSPWETIKHYTQ